MNGVGAPAGGRPGPSGGAAFAFSQIYYYAVSLVGLGLVIAGAIQVVFGIQTVVFPAAFQHARNGWREVLGGIALLLPGGLALWWHLREARSRESAPISGSSWGQSLYLHGAAVIALAVMLVGVVIALRSLVDAVLPQCFSNGFASVSTSGVGSSSSNYLTHTTTQCFPSHAEALRGALNGLLILIVGGLIWFPHLRAGRHLGSPETSA